MATLAPIIVNDGTPCPACSWTTWVVTVTAESVTNRERDTLTVTIDATAATCQRCGHSVELGGADATDRSTNPVA